jgi:vitamin B12 transporter
MSCAPSWTRPSTLAAALAVMASAHVCATEQVVVSATRTPMLVTDAVAEVSVIDRDALDRTEARTLADVLAQLPGLQASSNGGLGKPSFLYVRGLEARHVLLLVDGVRVGSATLNAPSLDNLPLDSIERIEVVRGPLTSLYGSGAMGGVVQVFTRRAGEGTRGNARVAAGSHAYALGSAGISHAGGGLDFAVQVQGQRTDGFSATNPNAPFGAYNGDDDGFSQAAGSVRAGWAFAPQWRLEALWLESRGKTDYDDGPGADARAELHTRVASLQVDGRVSERWATRLLAGESIDGYDTIASASPWTELGLIETDQRQLSWENRVRLPLGEALLVAERIEQRVTKPGDPYDVDRRTVDALAAGWTVHQGPHDLQASLRRDDDSQFGGQTTGALAYAFAFADAWRLGGSWGTSFTAPSFNQLYYPGFGNPDLQPEDGDHGELFAQWRSGVQQVRATAYRHRYRSYISAGPVATNIPRVAIDGVTLAWDAQLDAVRLAASYDWVDPRNDTAGSPNDGKLLPRRAQRAFKAGADWTRGPWTLGGALQAYSQRYDDVANTVRLGGYGVVDLYADWRVAPDWQLGVRLNNVADKAYETAYGYNQPGREAYVTLRWSME